MKKLFFLLAIALTTSCGAINSKTIKMSNLIEPDMTKKEVLEIMGAPGNKQFKDNNAAWQYCQTSILGSTDKFVVIWFYDKKVTGMTTYTQSFIGMCESFFKSINWEEAPDHTIEFRER